MAQRPDSPDDFVPPVFSIEPFRPSPAVLARVKAMPTSELLQRYRAIMQARPARQAVVHASNFGTAAPLAAAHEYALRQREAEYQAIENNPERHRAALEAVVAANM